MIQQKILNRTKLYKFANGTNEKVKSIILILCTQLIFEFDKIECDNQIFKGTVKFAIKNLKKILEDMLDRYYSGDDKDHNFIQADAINQACLINEHYLLLAFSLANKPEIEALEFTKKFNELLIEFDFPIPHEFSE